MDTLCFAVPDLQAAAELELELRASDRQMWLFGGEPFGAATPLLGGERISPALRAWLISDLPAEVVDVVSSAVWVDLGGRDLTADDVAVIERVLRRQPTWVLWAERDTDQAPVVRRPMTSADVAEHVSRRANVVAWRA